MPAAPSPVPGERAPAQGTSIRTAQLVTGVAVAVLAVVMAVSLAALHASLRGERAALARQAEVGQLARDLGAASDLLTAQARAFAVTGDRSHLDAYWAEIDQTRTRDRVIARLTELGVEQDLLDLLAKAKANSDALVGTETRSQRLMLEAAGVPRDQMPGPVAAWELSRDDARSTPAVQRAVAASIMFDDRYDADKALIMEPVAAFDDLLDRRAAQRVATERARTTSALATITVVAVLGVAVLAGMLVAQHVLLGRPGRLLARAATGRRPDDLTPIDQVGGAREMRQLTDAFNRQLSQVGDLARQLTSDAASAAGTADSLARAGEEAVTRADATLRLAGDASAATERVAGAVGAGAAGMEQMTSSITEIARNASSAATVARSAVTVTGTTRQTVARLGESTTEIGNVLQLIEAIAGQTNLLALNATIEAARAGEAGKGFAVVATEVKDLAQSTARATSDITTRMGAIESDVHAVVDAMTEIGSIISQINDAQSTIASAVEEQTATTQEISRSLAEAATATDAITAATREVLGAAEQARASAVESSQASARMASTLRAGVADHG